MPFPLSPKAHLQNAHGLIANALPSLEFCIATDAEPIGMSQQAGWIADELERAAGYIRDAQQAIADKARRAKVAAL